MVQLPTDNEITFQSHLYGIESPLLARRPTSRQRFNRTFMELKDVKLKYPRHTVGFQSHLYGIERQILANLNEAVLKFQSHLYGIESRLRQFQGGHHWVSIAPLWN